MNCDFEPWKDVGPAMGIGQEVVITGVPTRITLAIKDGMAMAFLFYIDRPCPVCESGRHWEMFDIRWYGIDQAKWMHEFIRNGSPTNLRKVAEIIEGENVFKDTWEKIGPFPNAEAHLRGEG